MKLQEQIAHRLREVWFNASGPTTYDDWLAVAVEVERCMEWARRECSPPDYTDADGYARTTPLTLPPEDWKP